MTGRKNVCQDIVHLEDSKIDPVSPRAGKKIGARNYGINRHWEIYIISLITQMFTTCIDPNSHALFVVGAVLTYTVHKSWTGKAAQLHVMFHMGRR